MIPFPDRKYQLIYADPPWSYQNSGFDYSAAKQYQTMSTEDICSLNINNIADENCALFIWGTWPLLPDCLCVIKNWGFVYKTLGFIWLKTKENTNQISFLPRDILSETPGMGFWTMSNTEYCLIGTRGSLRRNKPGIRQVIYSRLREHSRKPDETRLRIVELMGNLPRIELFARQRTDGWDAWGNEI